MPTEYKFDDLDLHEEPAGAKPEEADATILRSLCQYCGDTSNC